MPAGKMTRKELLLPLEMKSEPDSRPVRLLPVAVIDDVEHTTDIVSLRSPAQTMDTVIMPLKLNIEGRVVQHTTLLTMGYSDGLGHTIKTALQSYSLQTIKR